MRIILLRCAPLKLVILSTDLERYAYIASFRHLTEILFDWTQELHADLPAVINKLRFIGIIEQQETSPKTWRWQQNSSWTKQLPVQSIKNVAIPFRLFHWFADYQDKTMRFNPPWRWDTDAMELPLRNPASIDALHLAVYLYDLGNSQNERQLFARQLVRTPGMKQSGIEPSSKNCVGQASHRLLRMALGQYAT